MTRFYLAAIGLAIAVGVAVGISRLGSTTPPANRFAAPPAGCIEMGSTGRQIWHAHARTASAAALGDALESIADANRYTVSGVPMCSDYSGVVIFVVGPARAVLARVAAVSARYPQGKVYVQNVAAGLMSQLAAVRRVVATDPSGAVLTGVGPNIYTGGLHVDVRSEKWPVSERLRSRMTAAATADGAVKMPISFRVGGQTRDLPMDVSN